MKKKEIQKEYTFPSQPHSRLRNLDYEIKWRKNDLEAKPMGPRQKTSMQKDVDEMVAERKWIRNEIKRRKAQ